jgi:hypothetical protein
VAGILFQKGYSLQTVASIMSFAALLAAGVLSLLKLKPDQTGAEHATAAPTSLGGATAASS